MKTCNKCSNFNIKFDALHITPAGYLEGKKNAKIWIIGLNPSAMEGTIEKRTAKDFENFIVQNEHKYFKHFKKVSHRLYDHWSKENNTIAHTDLIKCFSPSFPPNNLNKGGKEIKQVIHNCSEYLIKQIEEGRPQILICNGSYVCNHILDIFPPIDSNNGTSHLTSYQTIATFSNHQQHSFWVILSGFIGRIDDRNKIRLGREIEGIITKCKIQI